jgi:hypothetical protein
LGPTTWRASDGFLIEADLAHNLIAPRSNRLQCKDSEDFRCFIAGKKRAFEDDLDEEMGVVKGDKK